MSGVALVGALVGVAVGLAYFSWVRSRVNAPLPTEPHGFDPEVAVRFLGTAKVGRRVAAWPRGELIADGEVILVRASQPGGGAEVLLRRREIRDVRCEGGRLARRVTFDGRHRGDVDLGELRFGAAFADPAPVLRDLGWPVTER